MKIYFLKIGNTNICLKEYKKKQIIIIKNKDLDKSINKIKKEFSEGKIKVFVCSTNKKLFEKIKAFFPSVKFYYNNKIKNNIDYSFINKKQIGIDLYYSIEFLSRIKDNFFYFSFGTFYAECFIKKKKLIGINIMNSLYNELTLVAENSDIKINIISICKEIKTNKLENDFGQNNRASIINGLFKLKEQYFKKRIEQNEYFFSGSEGKLFIQNNKNYLNNIEIKSMEFFYQNNLLK
ncbi:MAG: hypothetical protein ACRDBR_01300 [Metamycoplasmataceae bacterium]